MDEPPLMLPLTDAQVEWFRSNARAQPPRLHLLLAAATGKEIGELTSNGETRLSKSLLTGLTILAIASAGKPIGPTDIGSLSASSVVPYLKTWVAVGAVEQVSGSYRYQLAEHWR